MDDHRRIPLANTCSILTAHHGHVKSVDATTSENASTTRPQRPVEYVDDTSKLT